MGCVPYKLLSAGIDGWSVMPRERKSLICPDLLLVDRALAGEELLKITTDTAENSTLWGHHPIRFRSSVT
jgi:hypothetical protein